MKQFSEDVHFLRGDVGLGNSSNVTSSGFAVIGGNGKHSDVATSFLQRIHQTLGNVQEDLRGRQRVGRDKRVAELPGETQLDQSRPFRSIRNTSSWGDGSW